MSTPVTPAYGAAPEMGAPPALWDPAIERPMTEEDTAKWWERLDRGITRLKQFHPQWERGLKNYTEALITERRDTVDALLDFRHVETKKSQLHHRTPEVMLVPSDPKDPMVPKAIFPLRQKLLNYEIGPRGANAKRALHKGLIDTLAASGYLITEVGFAQVTLPLQVTQPGIFGQPPAATTQQIPIWSRRFISSLSSKKLIIPAEFNDSADFDSAPFLAYEGTLSLRKARKAGWQIPSDFTSNAQADEAIFQHGLERPTGATDDLLRYVKVWYRASDYDDAVFNPELFRCLILVKGIAVPVWHRDSPFQSLTPQGALTDDSMIGNPIHLATIRDLTDSAVVPSDLVVGEQLSTELNNFRGGLVDGRKKRKPIIAVNAKLGQAKIDAITMSNGVVVLPEEFFDGAGNQSALVVMQTGTEPRDNYAAQDIIERDYNEALGLGSNQRGQIAQKKTTATEARIVQGNSSARAETEKDRIREYFVGLVRKFDTILQRTATSQEVTKILGQQGAALWMQWKVLPGRYAYDIVPDSGQFVDAREYLDRALNTYNLMRKDDRVIPEEVIGDVARALHKDPATFIAPPVDKTLEPPKQTVSVNLVDLNDPVAGRVALDLFANAGVKLSPETIQLIAAAHARNAAMGMAGNTSDEPIGTNTPPNDHRGSADLTEPVNQHQTERTGRMQGSVQ